MNAMAAEIKEAIIEKDTLYEICSELITFFESKDSETGLDYFKVFLRNMTPYDWVDELTSDFLNSDNMPKERTSELARLINTLMEKQIEKRVSEETFYKELWTRLLDEIVLPTHEDRTIFLQILWSDFRIPYFQIGEGCFIQEEEFKRIVDKLYPDLQKGEFIMNANIPYKSQRASLLIEIANGLDEDTERIVFWSVLIGSLRSEINMLRSILSDTEADDED